MALYNIYHGLGGGFGGAQYDYTGDFATEEDAESVAYQAAYEDYESYEGFHGLRDWAQVAEEYLEEECIDCDIDELPERTLSEIDYEYQYEIESWIDWKVILADEDENVPANERMYL